MKKTLGLFVLLLLMAAGTAVASNCCPDETTQKTMDHGTMDHGECPDSMAMQGQMMMLGADVQHGVEAMAHLKDVTSAMAKVGMETTHHLMLMFHEVTGRKALDQGSVAVKITMPDGTQGKPLKLIGMQGHFGADVTLNQPGTYLFTVGTRLDDGTKRVFTFNYTD